MDEFNSLHLSSPPSSLPDGLISAQGTVPPIPRPRRGSSSSSSSYSSTPKQVINFHGSLTRTSQSNSSNPNSRNCNKNNKIIRTPSIDSTGALEVKLKPLLVDNSDADSEEEEEHHVPYGNSNERLNCSSRSKKTPHPRYASRSLPVTPRVNGNCSGAQNHMNGGMSSSFITGSVGSSTPLLVAPHMANHFPLDGSLNSISSLSPIASQYVTCSSGIMSETPEKVLPGSIDYSSLPLPREDSFRIPNKRHISRHMSEPCIHEIPNGHCNSIVGKCYSCPTKKNSSKHKKKDPVQYSADNELTGADNHFRNSIGGIDTKSDNNLETVEMQWKFIRTLVDELNKCRCQNNRMAVELHQSQMEIQMLKGALDAYIDAGIQPGVLSEMVGQIHAAQKVRDEAMMSRIKLANEERDAAITQTQSLLEKLGYSPKSSVDYLKFNVYCNDQSSHCNYQSSSCKSNKENLNLSSIEEELKALRLALHLQEQEKPCHSDHQSSNKGKEPDGDTQEVLEELKTKLKESEVSKLKLQEKCSSLEHVFEHLHRKINGLSSVEGLSLNPSSLSFLDMSLYGNKSKHEEEAETSPRLPNFEAFSPNRCKKNTNDRVRKPVEGDTETEGESLSSSADSAETSSATSWKHICLDNHTYPSNESGSHCSPVCGSRQTSALHSHDGINNNASKNISTPDRTPSSTVRGEFKPRNLGGVTLMGPITEL